MDYNTPIKTESLLEDSFEALDTEPFCDSFVPPASLSPSEYQPSPSPERLSRVELLPKALSQDSPMAVVNGLPKTSKSGRPSSL